MDDKWRLHDKEYAFACIVWENEPIASGVLAKLCSQKLNWKRTTTYTVLKKLCDRGILTNENTIVTSLIKKEMVQRKESRRFIEKIFDDSISNFVVSFAKERKLSKQEIEELREWINTYEDGENHE